MGIGSNNDISTYANLIKIPELIYIIIVSVTMLSVNGKKFWLINLICVLLKIINAIYYCFIQQSDKPVSGLIAFDLILSFTIFLETLMQAFDTFYTPSGAGKVIANIAGMIFVLAYSYLLYYAVEKSQEGNR